MAVNALERIAILRNLASEIIAEIELLAAPNPNLIRLRADLINNDKLHISEAWDDETLIRYAYYWLKQNDELRVGWDNARITLQSPLTHIINILRRKRILNLQTKQVWKKYYAL